MPQQQSRDNQGFISVGQPARELRNFETPQNLKEEMNALSADQEKAYRDMVEGAANIGERVDEFNEIQKAYIDIMRAKEADLSQMKRGDLNKFAKKIEESQRNVGNDISLSREADELARQLEDVFNDSQKRVEDARNIIVNERETIAKMVSDLPKRAEWYKKHLEALRSDKIQKQVSSMPEEDLINEVRKTPEFKQKSRQEKTMFFENRGQIVPVAQKMMQRELQRRDVESRQREQGLLEDAQFAEASRLNYTDTQFDRELDSLVQQGRITPREAMRYRGGQNRQEFDRKFSPFLAKEYINGKTGNGPPTTRPVPIQINNQNQPPGAQSPVPPTGTPPSSGVPPTGTPPGGTPGTTGPPPSSGSPGLPPNPANKAIDVFVTNTENSPVPVTGGGGGGTGGSGGGGSGGSQGGRSDTNVTLLMEQLSNYLSGVSNNLYDIASPGGSALGQAVPGMAGGALRQGIPLLAGAGMIGTTAAVGAGAVTGGLVGAASAWHEGAQFQQGIERQFGENQSRLPQDILSSPMFQAQVSARLSNIMLGGPEIEELTSAMANLGATAEEAAEALGPAAEALDQYRVMDAETTARASLRGSQFSSIGAREANVMGAVMERLSGSGISTGAMNQASETAAGVYESMGVPMGDYAGLGAVNMYGIGGPETDMIFESTGAIDRAIETGGAILADPMYAGAMANMYTGTGFDYTTANAGTPEGRARATTATNAAVMKAASGYLPRLIRDENGEVDLTEARNITLANQIGQNIPPELGGPMDGSLVLAEIRNTEAAGGTEAMYEAALAPEQMAASLAEEEQKLIEGETQKRESKRDIQRDTAVMGAIANEVPPLKALEPFAMNLAGLMSDKSAVERGEAGGFAAADEYLGTQGGYLGTVLGTEGRGWFDSGINPSEVIMRDQKGKEVGTLSDVEASDKLTKLFEENRLTADVDVGGETQRIAGSDLATAAASGELAYESGIFGKGLTMGDAAGGADSGVVQIEFTDEARNFFRPADPKNRFNYSGQVNESQFQADVASGKEESYSNTRSFYGP